MPRAMQVLLVSLVGIAPLMGEEAPSRVVLSRELTHEFGNVMSIATNEKGTELLLGTDGRIVVDVKATNGELVKEYRGVGQYVAFASKDREIVTANIVSSTDADKVIEIIDRASGKVVKSLKAPYPFVSHPGLSLIGYLTDPKEREIAFMMWPIGGSWPATSRKGVCLARNARVSARKGTS
jgi:hypothetical protein